MMLFSLTLMNLVNFGLISVYGLNNATAATPNETTTSSNCTDKDLNLQCIDKSLKTGESSLGQLVLVTFVSGAWVIYLTYYNSIVVGFIISKIIGKFVKDAYFHIGSFSFSVLSGKLMFRDVSYITNDCSIHINDGYCIFRWWRPYHFTQWPKQQDLSHGHTRLSVVLFGFECHVYNRVRVYKDLQNLFEQDQHGTAEKKEYDLKTKGQNDENTQISWWRSLLPVIKFTVSPGKVVIGNRLLPQTFVFVFTEGDLHYKTTEASNCYDLFLHVIEGTLKSAKLMLVPSVRFDPSVCPLRMDVTSEHKEPPPRKMGEGYVVINTNLLKIKYLWDEAGLVKDDVTNSDPTFTNQAREQLVHDDEKKIPSLAKSESCDPMWEIMIQFGKRTAFNYGPWADRQRDILFSYFYPADYQRLQVTKPSKPGEKRIASSLKISAMLVNGADFDLLFARAEDNGAFQINTGEGSYVEITIPMVVNENGYSTHIYGQLLHADLSTSMQYQNFLKAETLGFDIKAHYPLKWNGFQTWNWEITASKASLSLVFAHRDFFSDISYDWSYKSPADLLSFIPYIYKFHIRFDLFELYLPLNKFNWIDCQSKAKENAYLALHGKVLELDFNIPNETFLPPICTIPIDIVGKELQLCAFLPKSNMARNMLAHLAFHQRKWGASIDETDDMQINWETLSNKKWGLIDEGWTVVGELPLLMFAFKYSWHPIVIPYEAPTRMKSATPSQLVFNQHKEELEIKSSSLNTKSEKKPATPKQRVKSAVTFDPTSLDPDELTVDIQLPRGTLILYGSLIDLLVAFKDNYLGYDDVFTDFSSKQQLDVELKKSSSHNRDDNILQFRPFNVVVNVNLQNIGAILPIHHTSLYASQPRMRLKQLHFEMDKNCLQTRMQLLLVELEVSVKETRSSLPNLHKMTRTCRLELSSLQLRGHAMFSNAGIPLGSVLIEYAWLTEVLIGDIKGLLSITQSQALIEWLDSFLFLASNDSNQLKKAFPCRKLPTGITWEYKKSDGTSFDENDVKYMMTRIQLRSIEFRLAHDTTLLDLKVSPIFFANGNVQEQGVAEAVSVEVKRIHLKHYTLKPSTEEWLEAGEIQMGPIFSHAYIASQELKLNKLQDEFLRFHDKKTRRLFFVWEHKYTDTELGKPSALLDKVKTLKSWGCVFFASIGQTHTNAFEYFQHGEESLEVVDGFLFSDSNEDEDQVKRFHYGVSLLNGGVLLMPPPSKCKFKKVASSESSPIVELPSSSSRPSPYSSRVSESALNVQAEEPEKTFSAGSLSLMRRSERTISVDSDKFQSVGSQVYHSSSTCKQSSSEQFFSAESDMDDDLYHLPKATRSITSLDEIPPGSANSSDGYENENKHSPLIDQFRRIEHCDSKPDLSHISSNLPGTVRAVVSSSDVEIELEATRPEDSSLFDKRRPSDLKLDLRNNIRSEVDIDVDERRKYSQPSRNVLFNAENPNKACELGACYGYVLATAQLQESDDWMPGLTILSEGLHPSIIIDRPIDSKSRLKRRSSMDIFRSAQSENCTSIILHIKGGLNVQVSPFLLQSLHEIVDALTSHATHRHPSSILSHLQASCTRDAINDHHLSKLTSKDALSEVLVNTIGHDDGSKKKLKVFIDLVRINIVQATPGDDSVFNLRLNKMVPTPCITVASIRLDRLDVSAQLNSKADKLLSRAVTKARFSLSLDNDASEENMVVPNQPLVLFSANASVHSLACQLRVLSHNGCAPERSNIISLSDENCRAPFRFNPKIILPHVKEAIRKSDFRRHPPKPWGWVMFEVGINEISAQFTKHDVSPEDPWSYKKAASDGSLSVDMLWLNAVTPQSSSQTSKISRACRTWNLLTAVAPTCCAWLVPADRLASSLKKFSDVSTKRFINTTGAAVALVMEDLRQESKKLFKPKENKHNLLSDMSLAIINDKSCILCDYFQFYFCNDKRLSDLESVLADDRNIPPPITLRFGVELILKELFHANGRPPQKIKRKFHASTLQSTPAPIRRQSTRRGNIIELSPLKETRTSLLSDNISPQPVQEVSVTTNLVTSTLHADKVVIEQMQTGIYSWMKNQPQSGDIESQAQPSNSGNKDKEKVAVEMLSTDFMANFKNFFSNAGLANAPFNDDNILQSYFSGSFAFKLIISKVRMEKQSADCFYAKEISKRSKREKLASMRRNQQKLPDTPIIVCQNIIFNNSIFDNSPLEEMLKKESNLQKMFKNRSKLSVNASCSIGFVKQRIDIALVRLIYQFVHASAIIQQTLTDMKVNQYTAGVFSPDPYLTHRRGFSNVSGSLLCSPALYRTSTFGASARRRTSIAAPPQAHDDFDTTSTISDQSLQGAQCWLDFYKLVDEYKDDKPNTEIRFESDLRQQISSDNTKPFITLELSFSLDLQKVQLVAEMGSLSSSIILVCLNASVSHQRTAVTLFKNEYVSSMEASLKEINADVSDDVKNNKKTIVSGHVGVCRFNVSINQENESSEEENECSLSVGKITLDLPQRPSSIHDVVARSTRRLSVHLQEFSTIPVLKPSSESFSAMGSVPPSVTNVTHFTPFTPSVYNYDAVDSSHTVAEKTQDTLVPSSMNFELTIEGLEFGANMLPSSIVRYTSEEIIGSGVLSQNGSFEVKLRKHDIHFSSKIPSSGGYSTSTAVIPLPRIYAEGEMRQHQTNNQSDSNEMRMKEGEYLNVNVGIGSFEHTLNTDIVNQLIFLQEVAVHELENILNKMTSKGSARVPSESSLKTISSTRISSPMLYQLQLQLDGIQLTACTPSRSAVRLKTGKITFEITNRVIRAGWKQKEKIPKYMKIFGKAQVELGIALGTLIYNRVYPEVEPEFQQLAYFTTRIGLQNTTQAEQKSSRNNLTINDQNTAEDNSLLINVTRPIFFVQPTAFDKAILFFLVYKNAYDDWTEKREVLESSTKRSATQMLSAFQGRYDDTSGSDSKSSLYLQLAVDDLGICLPVARRSSFDFSSQDEFSAALVLTIDHTMISAYYARSLVSAGQFKGFCLRFADDFQVSLDDWAPKSTVYNSFRVPDGTYQICTDTTSYNGAQMGARTSVNVVWKMKGMDVRLNTKIGYYLTKIVDTMTLITGNSAPTHSSASDKLNDSDTTTEVDSLSVSHRNDGPRKRRATKKPSKPIKDVYKENLKKMENDYNEQVRLIDDLRSLGAKQKTVDEQEERLHELEGLLSSMVRRNFRERLRRGSIKASSLKVNKSPHLSHHRSVSAGVAFKGVSPSPSIKSNFATLPSQKSLSSNSSSRRVDGKFSTSQLEADDESSNEELEVLDIGKKVAHHLKPISSDDQSVFRQSHLKSESVDLELILDIRIGIDGGKIICQPDKEEGSNQELNSSGRFPTFKSFDANETTFHVPGVSVKCRYNSSGVDVNDQDGEEVSQVLPTNVPLIEISSPGGSSSLRKRSCIYVWFSLQSLPETIISPCFLDFLEQTLQGIPVSSVHPHLEEDGAFGAVESLDSTIASLPMDAIVYVNIQPSHVLFNCQPTSRVECLLHIPSLDACFSNLRKPRSKGSFQHLNPGLNNLSSSSTKPAETKVFPSGLAISVVMSDFSIYIFHPYGTQLSSAADPKLGSGRKDSLSVDLEVVRINIVRSKKGTANLEPSVRPKDRTVIVNMSTLVEIGKASFKYDMRRLSEILAFPRAWYRRSITRRMFLGDSAEERLSVSDIALSESPQTPRRTRPEKRISVSSNKEDWTSVVLYCLKMSQLNVQMNMSNVMGNTLWSCDGLRSQGKFSVQSSGDQDLFLSCGLEKSRLIARGGIIGGHIELKSLFASCRILEPIKSDPLHKLFIKINLLDGRIEYMGACIMIGKLTNVYLKLIDEWQGPKRTAPTSAEKSVFVPGDFTWENFSLAISRSTTPDIIKMLAKLEEFFTQQFQNSVRVLSSLTESPGRRGAISRRNSVSTAQPIYAFHRQWPSVYGKIRSLGIKPNFLLGGSLALRGSHLTIVCFHGNNFRSKTWILFNILEPNIMFSTEVQQIKESMERDETSTLSNQSLIFNLGHDYLLKTSTTSSDPMATVSRVTRSRHDSPPPTSASIDDWFAYITASHTQELSMLRTLNDIRAGGKSGNSSSSGGIYPKSSLSTYTHDTDIIFALPKLELDFRTEHLQGPREPNPQGDKPIVECTFVTEFTDHICVTMDVELIMYLHDLVSSYLKEKQQALSSRPIRSDQQLPAVDLIDIRQFVCNTWQLEPTVRLISWAGRRIEPVGVDYILQKLGFRHARTTIPKWFQRGVLDVLDHSLALIVQNLLVAMHQRKRL